MDASGPRTAAELLQSWLAAGPHETLLSVGETGAGLLAGIPAAQTAARFGCGADTLRSPHELLESISQHRRFDAALVSDVVETLPADAAGTVIAALRDLHAGRMLVLAGAPATAAGSGPSPDLLALGLRGLGAVSVHGNTLQVYEYDAATYKKTPDWLNARHWAHPERWGRHRW